MVMDFGAAAAAAAAAILYYTTTVEYYIEDFGLPLKIRTVHERKNIRYKVSNEL